MKNKNRNHTLVSLLIGVFLLLLDGCAKDDYELILFNQNLEYGTATDIEGNIYKTIEIGTQTWMAENLRVTKLNDGTDICYGAFNDTIPTFFWEFDNPIFYRNTVGGLYNWYAVNTGKLCPSGWHVPTDIEWTVLTDFLGGDSIAGAKMKEAGTQNWYNPNEGATNESGFTALPNIFSPGYGYDVKLWSSTEFNNEYVWYRELSCNSKKVYRHFKPKGYLDPIRCVRDE